MVVVVIGRGLDLDDIGRMGGIVVEPNRNLDLDSDCYYLKNLMAQPENSLAFHHPSEHTPNSHSDTPA